MLLNVDVYVVTLNSVNSAVVAVTTNVPSATPSSVVVTAAVSCCQLNTTF